MKTRLLKKIRRKYFWTFGPTIEMDKKSFILLDRKKEQVIAKSIGGEKLVFSNIKLLLSILPNRTRSERALYSKILLLLIKREDKMIYDHHMDLFNKRISKRSHLVIDPMSELALKEDIDNIQ